MVHDLIKARALTFEDEDIPNVNENPLLDHQRSKINTVKSSLELQVERDVEVVCMPTKIVHKSLLKAGMLNGE